MPNYVLTHEQHIEADNIQDALEQAEQTFIDYPSSRTFNIREFGSDTVRRVNANSRQWIKLNKINGKIK